MRIEFIERLKWRYVNRFLDARGYEALKRRSEVVKLDKANLKGSARELAQLFKTQGLEELLLAAAYELDSPNIMKPNNGKFY